MYVSLCVKPISLTEKKVHDGQRACMIWIYEGSLQSTQGEKVTFALVHSRNLLYAFFDCWEKPLQYFAS